MPRAGLSQVRSTRGGEGKPNSGHKTKDFNSTVSADIVPLCVGKIKHLSCNIRVLHRAPGKNNLEWFYF